MTNKNKTEPLTMTKRKEVYLTPQVIAKLKIKADMQGRILKNYMEQVLINDANSDIDIERIEDDAVTNLYIDIAKRKPVKRP